ncbi:MAG: hypothetical protein QMD36_00815 [Candidatus Aenigmarchaeota archaeon]|nr:hypothetical protein [Candidatus Aenigmarchaeota archaeon]
MDLVCPKCGSKVNELIECDNCGSIGCIRCVRKSYGKWICFKCETPEKEYSEKRMDEEERITEAFSSLFGT